MHAASMEEDTPCVHIMGSSEEAQRFVRSARCHSILHIVPTTVDILASLSSVDMRKCAYSLGMSDLKTHAAGDVALAGPSHYHHHQNQPSTGSNTKSILFPFFFNLDIDIAI